MITDDEYKHHSEGWNKMVEMRTQQLADEIQRQEEEDSIHREKTVNFDELYDNINLMYENHSPEWHKRVEEEQQKLDKEM